MSDIPRVILEPAVTTNNDGINQDLQTMFRQFILNSNAERLKNQNDISEIKDSIQGILRGTPPKKNRNSRLLGHVNLDGQKCRFDKKK